MKYRDSCNSTRPVADLLRWSMGSEPRYGKAYSDYEAPKDSATQTQAGAETGTGIAGHLRSFAQKALAVLQR